MIDSSTRFRISSCGCNRFRFGLVLLLILSAVVAHAQTAGRVLGEVKDQSGRVIAGAVVTLTNFATNSETKTSTNSEGRYLFALAEPGTYRLAVEHSGFKTSIQSDLRLEIDQNERLDVTL